MSPPSLTAQLSKEHVHKPLMTFDFNETGDYFSVNCICPDCRVTHTVPVTAPSTHLGALAIALLSACTMLDIDLREFQAAALELASHRERQSLEVRYRSHLEQERSHDGIDHRIIDPVQRVIVRGEKPPHSQDGNAA